MDIFYKMNNKFPLVQINRSKEKELYFYHLDHLGSASFITHRDGYPMQHQQYLPYGELFESHPSKTMASTAGTVLG
jgi:hypothetical protein